MEHPDYPIFLAVFLNKWDHYFEVISLAVFGQNELSSVIQQQENLRALHIWGGIHTWTAACLPSTSHTLRAELHGVTARLLLRANFTHTGPMQYQQHKNILYTCSCLQFMKSIHRYLSLVTMMGGRHVLFCR